MTTLSGLSTPITRGALVEVLAHAVLEQGTSIVLLNLATPIRSQKLRIASGV
jgi:hypothetical protein